jgi:hypothetical protein
MLSIPVSVDCPIYNNKQTVYCYNIVGTYICNGCDNSNGCRECDECKATVQYELNQTKSDNVP